MAVCQTCGACVGDTDIHAAWHKPAGHTGQHSGCVTCAVVRISEELDIDPNEPIPPGKKERFDEMWNSYRRNFL